jgi:hypothetical protein
MGRIQKVIMKAEFILDNFKKNLYDNIKFIQRQVTRKRSTPYHLTERAVRWLEGGLGNGRWKVAFEPDS